MTMKAKIGMLMITALIVISLVSVFQAGTVSAQVTHEVGSGKPYTTIQDAIDNATDGDIVLVYSGTYNEEINIDKSLTVKSVEGAEVTIINAQEAQMGVLINGAETIATFDGFTVENYDSVGILAGAFSPTWGDDPIEVHILNNIVYEPRIDPPHNNNIQMGDGTTGTIIGNEVSGAILESPDWSGSGILVAGSSNVLVSNNYVHNCEGGIQIVGYAEYRDAPAVNNSIENNLVENNETGISVQMYSTDTIIRYNDVLNNDEGIAVMAIDYSWEHSTPSGTKIHYNNIIGNTSVISSIWGSDNGEVPTEKVDASLNWWGTTNHADIFVGISGAVDFSLWLDAPYPEGMTTEERLQEQIAQKNEMIASLNEQLEDIKEQLTPQELARLKQRIIYLSSQLATEIDGTEVLTMTIEELEEERDAIQKELDYWKSLSRGGGSTVTYTNSENGKVLFAGAVTILGLVVIGTVYKYTRPKKSRKG